MDQEGTIIGSEFKRFSARTNLDAQLKSWLKMSLSVTYSDTKDDLKLADSDEGLIGYSLTTIPSIPIYNVDGSYSSVSQEGYTNPNPIAQGTVTKAFMLPQRHPRQFYRDRFLSFNVPEFIIAPTRFDRRQAIRLINEESRQNMGVRQ